MSVGPLMGTVTCMTCRSTRFIMMSVAEHDSTLKKSRLAFAIRIENLSKNSAIEVSIVKVEVILVTLRSTQSIFGGETTCLREPDRSIAPPGLSPLTTSTGGNTWIATTDLGSVVEDSEAEEEVDERRRRRGTRKTRGMKGTRTRRRRGGRSIQRRHD